jgi:hypothetical protein
MVTAIADRPVSFDYAFMPISDMAVKTIEDPKTGKKVVESVLVRDEELQPTERFWTSLYSRYGFNSAFFKYFDHAEVFNRISVVENNDRMRVCIERDHDGRGTLLGVSNPTKPIVVYDELMDMLGKYGGEDIKYHNGVVESSHIPRSNTNLFKIGGDDFVNRFLLATAIDGYGAPNIYLSLMRTICSNGFIGFTKAFRSSISLGKGSDDVAPSLTRALDGFGNDEGYAALRQRVETATVSWASVFEAQSLYTAVLRAQCRLTNKNINTNAVSIGNHLANSNHENSQVGSKLLLAFHQMTGDISKLYGLANVDALSPKRQRSLPVKCTVYDLMNFATEVATHYAKASGSRSLQGWLGNLIVTEYDMEGTKDRFADFADFHIDSKLSVGLTGSDYSLSS